ncbi:MAG: hypothetical protein WBX49_02510 [Candidatus Deferrimicrobiaceae bacterium]
MSTNLTLGQVITPHETPGWRRLRKTGAGDRVPRRKGRIRNH